jgi:hypothetical protein
MAQKHLKATAHKESKIKLQFTGPRNYLSRETSHAEDRAKSNYFFCRNPVAGPPITEDSSADRCCWHPVPTNSHCTNCIQLRRYHMNGRSKMYGGKNSISLKEINANRFFRDSHCLEICKNHFGPLWDRIEGARLWTLGVCKGGGGSRVEWSIANLSIILVVQRPLCLHQLRTKREKKKIRNWK